MCSSWSKRHSSPSNLLFSGKLNFPVDQTNLITVDSKRTKKKLSLVTGCPGHLKLFDHEQNPSNADAHFESTKIKNPTFLKNCLSEQWCVKGKVFKQKRDTTTNWKSHQENFESQTKLRLTKKKPNNNVQSLDHITWYCVYFVLLEVT
jgi:hypothetical protein